MTDRRLAFGWARALGLGLLMLSTACARSESVAGLTAPSAAPSILLTIRVQARGSEAPICGALVRHETAGYYTDASGESLVSVGSGAETTIDVSAAGYHAMQATAVLNSHERWTFFLEPESDH